jgi:hypothetical protein
MSNRIAILDRLTKLIRGRQIPDFSWRFESDQPIGFELPCVEACPSCAVTGQRRAGNGLKEKIVLLGGQNGLRRRA